MYFTMEPSRPEPKIRPLLGISFSYSSSSPSSTPAERGVRGLEYQEQNRSRFSNARRPNSEDEDDDEYEYEIPSNGRIIGSGRLGSMVKYIGFLALHSQPEPVKGEVENGSGIES
jgi:hypothetical protein